MTAQVLYGKNIPAAPPAKRSVDIRSLAYGAAGPEPFYPSYQFSGYRVRWEQPGHNPFVQKTPGVPPYF